MANSHDFGSSFAMTESGVDLVIRGMMRSLSKDFEFCHSCMAAYPNVFNVVLAFEQIYSSWGMLTNGIEGSYRIFVTIVSIYDEIDNIN